jgi:uncharacterized protein YecE (DUF72 family)
MTCDIRIGTSGFHYKHWKGPFYPEKTPATKLLDFYVRHFERVELNNRFYRFPQAGHAAANALTLKSMVFCNASEEGCLTREGPSCP